MMAAQTFPGAAAMQPKSYLEELQSKQILF